MRPEYSHKPTILMIDNYDSFAHNLARYIEVEGAVCELVRNDEVTVDQVLDLNPTALVISPGPCTPNEAGISLALVKAAGMDLPLLGVCLGHQCIAQTYGGQVKRAHEPVHGKASIIHHDGRGIFQYVPNPLKVGRYHSLIVELDPKGPLVATAHTSGQEGAQEIMALAHHSKPQVGIQFHPESILTDHGAMLIQNFISFAEGWRRSRQITAEAAQ